MLLMMTTEDAGEAMRLLARRFLRGIEPKTDNERIEDFLASAIPKLEADEATYIAKVEAGRKGGLGSGVTKSEANAKSASSKTEANGKQNASTTQAEPKQNASTVQAERKQKATEQGTRNLEQEQGTRNIGSGAFRPPTLEQVKAYCEERGNRISAERFINHYTSNGWMVGRTRMKDWKAAVRNWERNEFDKTEKNTQDMQTHEWDYDALEELAVQRAWR